MEPELEKDAYIYGCVLSETTSKVEVRDVQ